MKKLEGLYKGFDIYTYSECIADCLSAPFKALNTWFWDNLPGTTRFIHDQVVKDAQICQKVSKSQNMLICNVEDDSDDSDDTDYSPLAFKWKNHYNKLEN